MKSLRHTSSSPPAFESCTRVVRKERRRHRTNIDCDKHNDDKNNSYKDNHGNNDNGDGENDDGDAVDYSDNHDDGDNGHNGNNNDTKYAVDRTTKMNKERKK